MKRKVIYASIAACFIGIMLWLVGMTTLGWDFWELDVTEYEHKTYTTEENIEILDIENTVTKIIIKRGESFSMDYHEDIKNPYTIKENGGTLKISLKNKTHLPFQPMFKGLKAAKYTMTITIPNTVKKLEISTLSSVTLENIDLEDIDIKTVNGNVSLNSVSASSAKIDVGNGSITAEKTDISDRITADTTNGEILFTDFSCKTIDLTTTNGRIISKNVTAFKNMTLHSVNGDIISDKVSAENYHAQIVNGDIKGTLLCPYIHAQTTNGNIELSITGAQADYRVSVSYVNGKANIADKLDGENSLSVKTVNGNINVTFVQN